jgi:hypothetical protein
MLSEQRRGRIIHLDMKKLSVESIIALHAAHEITCSY